MPILLPSALAEVDSGRRTAGEEIVGLTRGLLAAGARAVIVTLWSVPDLPTAVLMVRFHRLVQQGADMATALRYAEVWLSGLTGAEFQTEKAKIRDLGSSAVKLAGPEHPQQRAPFVVIGA